MMASRDVVIAELLRTGVLAVVRTDEPQEIVKTAKALLRGDVTLIEITMTVPSAFRVIEHIVAEMGSDVLVGAGTVLDATTARLAISAGASFLVAPTLDLELIQMAHRYNAAAIPGCLTPTELAQACSGGADVIKLFPGRVATPGYFADLFGPFPGARLMPTGNVNLDTAPQYIQAGAVAVGVGKAMLDAKAISLGDWDGVTALARQFRSTVEAARSAS